MDCPRCGARTVAFAVPEDCREPAPVDGEAAAICPRCLTVSAADAAPEDPDFARVSDALPDGEGGAAAALLVGLLDSLATNRAAIEALVDRAERRGVDPLLVVDRLAADRTLDPAVDLRGRRTQLEQLL